MYVCIYDSTPTSFPTLLPTTFPTQVPEILRDGGGADLQPQVSEILRDGGGADLQMASGSSGSSSSAEPATPTPTTAPTLPPNLPDPRDGLRLCKSRTDCLCLADSLAMLITQEKSLPSRITAEELLSKIMQQLDDGNPEILKLLVDTLAYIDVDNHQTASKWIEDNRSIVQTDFDATVSSLPKTLTSSDRVSTDFKAWISLLLHARARYHFHTWPDRVFAFVVNASACLYSSPQEVIKFHIFGDDQLTPDFALSGQVVPGVSMCYLRLSSEHYQPYLPIGYVLPPSKAIPLQNLAYKELVEQTTLVDIRDRDCLSTLEKHLNITFRFDGRGSLISKRCWPEFRTLLDCEVETAQSFDAEKNPVTWSALEDCEQDAQVEKMLVESVGCLTHSPAWSFEVSGDIDPSASCPSIAVAPSSGTLRAVYPTVPVVWGGLEAVKSSTVIEDKSVQLVISIKGTSTGLGADSTPEPDSQSEQLLFDELIYGAKVIQQYVEKGQAVAIHCTNGRTRSPTVVAAYLLLHQQLDWGVVKRMMDKAMQSCHQGRRNWDSFDRESRFTNHLKALGDGATTTADFATWKAANVVGSERQLRSSVAVVDSTKVAVVDSTKVDAGFESLDFPEVTTLAMFTSKDKADYISELVSYSETGLQHQYWPVHGRAVANAPRTAIEKDGGTIRVTAFRSSDVPLMTIELDNSRFQHFSNVKLDPLQFAMYQAVFQSKTSSFFAAGSFYPLKLKTRSFEQVPTPIVYVLMIGKQPKNGRSPLLKSATLAIAKWHTPPDCLVTSDWASKKENREIAATIEGIVILPLDNLDWTKELKASDLWDTPGSAAHWFEETRRAAESWFAGPIVHDGNVVLLTNRGSVRYPRPAAKRGISSLVKHNTGFTRPLALLSPKIPLSKRAKTKAASAVAAVANNNKRSHQRTEAVAKKQRTEKKTNEAAKIGPDDDNPGAVPFYGGFSPFNPQYLRAASLQQSPWLQGSLPGLQSPLPGSSEGASRGVISPKAGR